MVDSEKLSLCCSEDGRYLLLGVAGEMDGVSRGTGDGHMQHRGVRDGVKGDGGSEDGGVMRTET